MSAQDLEQRARGFLAAEYPDDPDYAEYLIVGESIDLFDDDARALRAIVAALRQQPAPVGLGQFREAVECWHDAALPANSVDAERKAEAKRLLSIIDNAGKPCPCGEATCTESWEPGCGLGESVEHAVPAEREPPRGDELRAILARQPAPVVDDAMRADAQRYRWLRRGKYDLRFARSVLNDSPEGIDAAIDAARAQGVQS